MRLYKPVQHKLSAYCRVVTGSEEKAYDLIQDMKPWNLGNVTPLKPPAIGIFS